MNISEIRSGAQLNVIESGAALESGDEMRVDAVASESLLSASPGRVGKDKLDMISWSRWGRNLAHKVGVAIITTVFYPFTARAAALHADSCLLQELPQDVDAMKKEEEEQRWKAISKIVIPTIESDKLPYKGDDVESFCKKIGLLSEHLRNPEPSPYKHLNRKMTRLLRDVLETKAYQALKGDADDPVIHGIHRLAAAIWNDVNALGAYQQLGAKMLLAKGGFRPGDNPVLGKDVVANLTETHEIAEQQLYSDLGWNYVGYGLANPSQVAQSMASQEGFLGSIANLAGHTHYDPHLQANNNPSLQGVATTYLENFVFKTNNCYGGTPTVGREISPEFMALLQGVENNNRAKVRDPEIPNFVFYINLQNMNLANGENPRSCSIMRLNERFPNTFLGITLPKDSGFYSAKEWGGVDVFAEKMKKYLLHKSSMSLEERASENRNPMDQGYFFPPHYDWQKIVTDVMDVVVERFRKIDEADKTQLCGSFQEYFYTLLQNYLESHIAKKLKEEGIESPFLMAVRACKENIDRGGIENMKYLYYHLGQEYFTGAMKQEGMSLITGVFHSRALSARKRMIHLHRAKETFGLLNLVSRGAFREDLKMLGVEEIRFAPA